MKHKISVYHYSFLPWTETFIYRQLTGLRNYNDIRIITHNIENEEEYPGFNPILVPERTAWRAFSRHNDRFFEKHLRGSDLFHVNFGHYAVDVQYHALRLGIPVTAYFLGVDASACLKDYAYRRKLKDSRFTAVFVNSEDMKNRLSPFLPVDTKLYVAYLGIPLEKFVYKAHRNLPDNAIFLQVGRLVEKKGVDITIKAFSRYLKIFHAAKLVIVGDGPLKSSLLQLVSVLKITDSVIFHGSVGFIKYAELLQSVDVFVHPSVTASDGDMEGLPTAVCEAMASGLPVISTKHSGIAEIIDDGRDGFLAEEGNIESVYNKMLLLKKVDIESISINARLKIELKFDHNVTIAVLAKHMENIMAGGVE